MNAELLERLGKTLAIPPEGPPPKCPSRVFGTAWSGKALRVKAGMWVYALSEEWSGTEYFTETVVMEDGSVNIGVREQLASGKRTGRFIQWYRFQPPSHGQKPYSIRTVTVTEPEPEGIVHQLGAIPPLGWLTSGGYLGLRRAVEILIAPPEALQTVLRAHNVTPQDVFRKIGDTWRGSPPAGYGEGPSPRDLSLEVWSQLVHEMIQSFPLTAQASLKRSFYGVRGCWTHVVTYPEKVLEGMRMCVKGGWSPLIPGWASTTGSSWHGNWDRGCGRHGLTNTLTKKSLSAQEEKMVQGYFDVCSFHSPPSLSEYSGAVSEEWEDMYVAACTGLSESVRPLLGEERNAWGLEAARSVPLMLTRASRSRKNEILLFRIATPATYSVQITPIGEVEDDGEVDLLSGQVQDDLLWYYSNYGKDGLMSKPCWVSFLSNRWGRYDLHNGKTSDEWKALMVKASEEVTVEEV